MTQKLGTTDEMVIKLIAEHFNSIFEETLKKEAQYPTITFQTIQMLLLMSIHLFFTVFQKEPMFATEVATKLLSDGISDLNREIEKEKMPNIGVSSASLN